MNPTADSAVFSETFGQSVFSIRRMKECLSEKTYKSLLATIREGRSLEAGVADEVAEAMKNWAVAHGATHFSHWFQPLTGATAEKHDSFIVPDREGGAALQFSGRELRQGEPDASSFPSGGIRSTFEARGYTAWDPTSPAFIKKSVGGGTLCIPSVFCSYHGEALDKKTPLLRSIAALSTQVSRLAREFGIAAATTRPMAQLGAEQEYFLIDRRLYEQRIDLIQTGRTLFGRRPAKHQQMSDHYFGAIKARVMNFMDALDRELWKLGIPSKTRHNEVCPGQFEIAPLYEDLNLAVDHNLLIMETLRQTAEQHGLACLLHEKPFAGVNGSGKHNNWSFTGPDGTNWLSPGTGPSDNARFLTVICALLKAVDTHAELVRATVASAGNDCRLGAHEAPPAIMSVFLGEQLTEIVEHLGQGRTKAFEEHGTIEIGVSSLPSLPRDMSDRNRTSPFAFTGNKFEFRAVGASQSCAGANIVLNTILAEALDGICTRIEECRKAGTALKDSLRDVLGDIVRQHSRIIFNGDNYSKEWEAEAARRGLPHIRRTPAALEALVSDRTVAMFEKHKVLSRRELESRHEVYRKEYQGAVKIEAECAANISRTLISPAAFRYKGHLAQVVAAIGDATRECELLSTRKLLREVCHLSENLLVETENLEQAVRSSDTDRMLAAMAAVREAGDALEGLLPRDMWPLPTYAEMMFKI